MRRKKKSGQSRQEQLHERFVQLCRLRHLEKATIKECAEKMKVSVRTVNNYLKDEKYQAVVDEMRKEWHEASVTVVQEMSQLALSTLKDVMQNSTSAKSRVEAAKTVGEWAGLNLQVEKEGNDDRRELERLARIVAERPTVTVINPIFAQPVRDGGLLPEGLASDVSPSDILGRRVRVVDADPTAFSPE